MRVLIEVSYDKQFESLARRKKNPNVFTTLTEINKELADHFDNITHVAPVPHQYFNYVMRISDINAGESSLYATDELVHGLRPKIEYMGIWNALRAQAMIQKVTRTLRLTDEQVWALSRSLFQAKSQGPANERKTAVMMGLHPRLGSDSLLSLLDDNIMVIISANTN